MAFFDARFSSGAWRARCPLCRVDLPAFKGSRRNAVRSWQRSHGACKPAREAHAANAANPAYQGVQALTRKLDARAVKTWDGVNHPMLKPDAWKRPEDTRIPGWARRMPAHDLAVIGGRNWNAAQEDKRAAPAPQRSRAEALRETHAPLPAQERPARAAKPEPVNVLPGRAHGGPPTQG